MKPRAGLFAALVVGVTACAAPPSASPASGQGVPVAATDVPPDSETTAAPAPLDGATPSVVPTPTPSGPSVTGQENDDEGGQASSPAPQPPDGPDASAAAPPPVASRPELPTLPDQAVTSHAGSAASDDLARAWAGSGPADWRVLSGFVGFQWDQELAGTIDVLTETITVRDGVAMGLVRNGRTTSAGPIIVTAGSAQTTALVPVARPGEPVPFRLTLQGVDATAVEWAAVAPEAASPARGLLLATWWQRGVTDARPADTYLWTDPDSGPRPIVVFGSATAVDEAVQGIEIASAWIDADGGVIGVADGIVGQPAIPAGGAADFVVATTGPDELDGAQLMLWGWGA